VTLGDICFVFSHVDRLRRKKSEGEAARIGSRVKQPLIRMWAHARAQRDGRSAKYRWRPLFNAAKFG